MGIDRCTVHQPELPRQPVFFSTMNKLVSVLFFALIATLFVQIPVYESDSGANTLNLYHVLIAATFVLTFRLRPSLNVSPDTLFFTVLMATSVLGWSIYGLTIRGALLPIAFVSFVVGNRWHQLTSDGDRRSTYQLVFAAVVIATIIRNLLYLDQLGSVYSRSTGDTSLFCLASGGKNLEATLLGIVSMLLIGTVAFVPAVFMAGVTSLFMMSRSGILAAFLSLMFWLIHGTFGRAKFIAGSTILLAALLACLLTFEGTIRIPIVERFDLSTERAYAAHDQGRLAIWSAAVEILSSQPLGHGVGNGFRILNDHMGGHLRENNAHNILVELALDGGVQTSLLFVLIMVWIMRTPGMILNPAHRAALAYGMLGLVEFTGYDAVGWFFIGVSHAARTSRTELVGEQE
jgi:hypothetical protein